ncbi:MAG: hypothetical protein ACR2JG_08505 [Geodermatophilaceae bacterium]
MPIDPILPTVYTLVVALSGSMVVCLGALAYLRRVRLERPAIGTFNRRDIVVVFGFIILLPVIYLTFPLWLITCLLILTFAGALAIGYRPLLTPTQLWLGIGVLLGANLWIGQNMLGTVSGWQLSWIENDIIVVLAAVAVVNLYVQGGMRLRHVAWFALTLAVYDALFIVVVPVTNTLVQGFLGYPLNPSFGMRLGLYNATLGIGDLLIYGLFTIAAFKAYGRQAARIALALVAVFGAITPGFAGLIFESLTDARTDLIVPAQTVFGPIAFIAYLWMRHHYGRERTMEEFLASSDVVRPVMVDAPAHPATAPEVAEPAPAALSRSSPEPL